MSYKYHIFLSYSHKDQDIMRPLRDYMRGRNLEVWTDEGIEPGTPQWQRAIEDAIKESGCMVVLATPASRESEWVSREISYADEMFSLRIIPFLVQGELKDSIPLALIDTQRIDARYDFDSNAQELVATIRRYLKIESIENQIKSKILIPGSGSSFVDNFSDFNRLNESQRKTLLFIDEYMMRNKYSPTIREILDGVDFASSTSVIEYNLDGLRNAGYIDSSTKSARTINIIKPFPKYDVFLSYSLADREIANHIHSVFSQKGLKIRISESADLNTIGSSIIRDEIRYSRCMVIVLSPYAKHSINVISHLIYLQETQTPLLPMLVKGEAIDALPFMLPHEYFDARNNLDTNIQLVAEELFLQIGKPPIQKQLL